MFRLIFRNFNQVSRGLPGGIVTHTFKAAVPMLLSALESMLL